LVQLYSTRKGLDKQVGSEQVRMTAQRSIVIGGGAFAGLALALAIRQGLGGEVPVIVAT
jgi:2-octaprenyl-6-methoxyphenol hydroxylase